jgi:hypothetical protein
MAWESSTDIFGRLDWLNKKTKNLLGRVYALENNTLRIAETTTTTTTTLPPEPPYKVYTALLTQSGGNDEQVISTGTLTIGVSYMINIEPGDSVGFDFTNVGASNNNQGTYFVATGTTPNSWGAEEGNVDILDYNTGAPVVTVLENTIGNIWFTYDSMGTFVINSDGLFTQYKTYITPQICGEDQFAPLIGVVKYDTNSQVYLFAMSSNGAPYDGPISPSFGLYSSIEIRVYPTETSFTLASTEFTNWGSGGGVTANDTLGFTTDGLHDAGTSLYNAFNFVGGKGTDIQTFFNNNDLLTDETAYIFNVTWGAGSSVSSGKVIMGCNGGTNLLIAPINTSNNNWQTPGQSNFDIESVVGTFNFPATFTLYKPITAQGIGWC